MANDEQCKIHTEKIDRICSDVIEIKKVLNGNGKMGLVGRVIIAEDWIARTRERRDGLYTWSFRVLILVILGMLGLK